MDEREDLSSLHHLFPSEDLMRFRILIACNMLTPVGAGFLHPYITPEFANHFLQCSVPPCGIAYDNTTAERLDYQTYRY
jgi:hypothetical protein